jgi:uncharacterized protein (TIGR00255 family)
MIHSMTGYGSAFVESEAVRASVTVKSLNHRFLDLSVHLSRRLQPLEREIKDLVQKRVQRGRVEVVVQAAFPPGQGESVVASHALVASLVRTLRDMQNEFGLDGGVAVSDLMRFPGALERVEGDANLPDEPRARILELVASALDGLLEMRAAEGARLADDLRGALAAVETSGARIAALSASAREVQRASLVARVRESLAELGLEDARLYQEVVRAVERHDVTEELQRLRSHLAMARGLFEGGAPAGKRLDFLGQEMMREANTIGSKAADAALVQEVVNLKAEIERLREQVQNVE